MKIEENDISYVVMGRLLYFCYHDKVKNDKMINPDLLLAADHAARPARAAGPGAARQVEVREGRGGLAAATDAGDGVL